MKNEQRRWGPQLVEVRALPLPAEGVLLPATCACCGDTAGDSRVERRARDGASVIVPYCGACHRHASTPGTRVLAASVASCLLAATLAAALPLLCEWWPEPLVVGVVLLGALAPAAATWLWPRRREVGHSATGKAAWWLSDGRFACTQPRWAAELATLNVSGAEAATRHEPALSSWMLLGVALALAAAPFFYWLYHPLVRVLDLGPTRVVLLVDGRQVSVVDPTSAESPEAGVELRLPSGRRHLEVRRIGDALAVASVDVSIEAGAKHLYAPTSDGYCFWLEVDGYGRGQPVTTRRGLNGTDRFWVLPELDTWFSPNPVGSADRRSSGGELTALRQSRCAEAPGEVRE